MLCTVCAVSCVFVFVTAGRGSLLGARRMPQTYNTRIDSSPTPPGICNHIDLDTHLALFSRLPRFIDGA